MEVNLPELVFSELQKLRSNKGFPIVRFKFDDVLLDEDMGIDSLDLAILVITLEEATGRHPFQNGFVMFETIGELISLFSN